MSQVSISTGAKLLTQLYDLALKFDYPTSSPLQTLGITLLSHSSTVFLDLLTYWIGLPYESRGFSDIKEWYNIDSNHEFFVQRMYSADPTLESLDLKSTKSMQEFNSLFQVTRPPRSFF